MPLRLDRPVIYDAVTLEHFAAAGYLPVLQQLHKDMPEPRWVAQVRAEVAKGVTVPEARSYCAPVLQFSWLGKAVEPRDLAMTMRLHALMSDGDTSNLTKNLGEAESMALAIELDGSFVTDDSAAYHFAAGYRSLGAQRVSDMCELLWHACAEGNITEAQVRAVHELVYETGRTMRCRCTMWPGSSVSRRLGGH